MKWKVENRENQLNKSSERSIKLANLLQDAQRKKEASHKVPILETK